MEQLINHYEYFAKLVKCNLKKYTEIVLQSTIDQLRALVNLIHLCIDKKSEKQKKLLKLLRSKRLCAKKISKVFLKHKVLIQSIICVALQLLIRMTSAAIIENDGECGAVLPSE